MTWKFTSVTVVVCRCETIVYIFVVFWFYVSTVGHSLCFNTKLDGVFVCVFMIYTYTYILGHS